MFTVVKNFAYSTVLVSVQLTMNFLNYKVMHGWYKSTLFGAYFTLKTFSTTKDKKSQPTERNEVAAACDLLYDLFLPSWSD